MAQPYGWTGLDKDRQLVSAAQLAQSSGAKLPLSIERGIPTPSAADPNKLYNYGISPVQLAIYIAQSANFFSAFKSAFSKDGNGNPVPGGFASLGADGLIDAVFGAVKNINGQLPNLDTSAGAVDGSVEVGADIIPALTAYPWTFDAGSTSVNTPGTGYTAGDVLTASTNKGARTEARVKVETVDVNGEVLTISLVDGGEYPVRIQQTDIINLTGGTGTGAQVVTLTKRSSFMTALDAAIADLSARITEEVARAQTAEGNIGANIGNLADLTTVVKDSIVAAINELEGRADLLETENTQLEANKADKIKTTPAPVSGTLSALSVGDKIDTAAWDGSAFSDYADAHGELKTASHTLAYDTNTITFDGTTYDTSAARDAVTFNFGGEAVTEYTPADKTLAPWGLITYAYQAPANVTNLSDVNNDLQTHKADTVKHITAAERTKWNAALQKSDVVNDVTTGGTDVPLSAEQGLILAWMIQQVTQSGFAFKGVIYANALPATKGAADLRVGNLGTVQVISADAAPNTTFPWSVQEITAIDADTGAVTWGAAQDYTPSAMDLWADSQNDNAGWVYFNGWKRLDNSANIPAGTADNLTGMSGISGQVKDLGIAKAALVQAMSNANTPRIKVQKALETEEDPSGNLTSYHMQITFPAKFDRADYANKRLYLMILKTNKDKRYSGGSSRRVGYRAVGPKGNDGGQAITGWSYSAAFRVNQNDLTAPITGARIRLDIHTPVDAAQFKSIFNFSINGYGTGIDLKVIGTGIHRRWLDIPAGTAMLKVPVKIKAGIALVTETKRARYIDQFVPFVYNYYLTVELTWDGSTISAVSLDDLDYAEGVKWELV